MIYSLTRKVNKMNDKELCIHGRPNGHPCSQCNEISDTESEEIERLKKTNSMMAKKFDGDKKHIDRLEAEIKALETINNSPDKFYCKGEYCNNEIPEPKMCCNGDQCGCMGEPIEPPLCRVCWLRYDANTTVALMKVDKKKFKEEINRLKTALKEIKLTALTTANAHKGLSHIVRVCIDAGITEKLEALKVKDAE